MALAYRRGTLRCELACDRLQFRDQLGGGKQGILAIWHRRHASVRGTSHDTHVEPAERLTAGDHAHRHAARCAFRNTYRRSSRALRVPA